MILVGLNILQGVVSGRSACQGAAKIIRDFYQLAQTGKYDAVLIINDCNNKNSPRFKYLPPFLIENTPDSLGFSHLDAKINNFIKLRKNTLDASQKIMQNISPDKTIHLCGFFASLDILATCFSLVDHPVHLSVLDHLVGDMDGRLKDRAMQQIEFLGIQRI